MSFLSEILREVSGNKRELRVSYEGYDFSFLSAKSASALEEVLTKEVIQTLRHKYQGLHLTDRQDGRITREVPSQWGGTAPTRILDP